MGGFFKQALFAGAVPGREPPDLRLITPESRIMIYPRHPVNAWRRLLRFLSSTGDPLRAIAGGRVVLI